MTEEQYTQAREYVQDINLLDSIMYSQNKNHWVEFVTPDGCHDSGSSNVFLDDFEEWVAKEKEKLSKLLEEL
jgi:hypothetical protein